MTPESLLKQYELALSSQSWGRVEPLMHKDVCVTFSNGTFKGISDVRSVFVSNFSSIKDEEYKISNVHWAYKSETEAVCLYQFNWKGIINGEMCSGAGRGTSVLVFDDERWQIITEHLGPNAE